MAPDLVRLIARRNVHGHEKKKESIQPPSRARLGACAQRSVGYTSRCTSIHIPGADAAESCIGERPVQSRCMCVFDENDWATLVSTARLAGSGECRLHSVGRHFRSAHAGGCSYDAMHMHDKMIGIYSGESDW
jgi:hypothetical protein